MILNKQEEFADAQLIPLSASTVNSTNVIDTLLVQSPGGVQQSAGTARTKDLGAGEPIWFVLQEDAAAVSGTSAAWAVVSSAAAALTTPTTHITIPAIAEANLTAGTTLAAIMLPTGS